MVVLDDFDDGDVNEWNINAEWEAANSRSRSGSWSGLSTINSNDDQDQQQLKAHRDFPGSVTTDGFQIGWYWQENDNANGHAVGIQDGGTPICAVGSDNPQWTVTSGDNDWEQVNGGNSSNSSSWVHVVLTFYPSSNNFDFNITDGDGNSASGTRSFINSGNPDRISVRAARVGVYPFTGGTVNTNINVWIDDIHHDEFTSPPSTPQNFSAAADGNDPNLSWSASSWNGDQGHYNIYRGLVGGSLTEIDSVSSGGTNYNDTSANQDNHYDYAVEAENLAGTSNLSNRDSAVTLPNAPSNLGTDRA